ncbi:hypothetical protein L3X38_017307 [Prunus dulcis]|uniref:F-box family protein with DUF295 n=1 Tax=Prunus dulcis TaxID=3755 RepID=A0AAD4W7L1_PRUDU|nr:hypothetical protein L3X38_017307 [Prunus dulcis]
MRCRRVWWSVGQFSAYPRVLKSSSCRPEHDVLFINNAPHISRTSEPCGARNALRLTNGPLRPVRIAARVDLVSSRPARIAARVDLVSPRPARIAARVDLVSPRPTRIAARVDLVSPRPARMD